VIFFSDEKNAAFISGIFFAWTAETFSWKVIRKLTLRRRNDAGTRVMQHCPSLRLWS
jgi:hypothetical protein